MLGSITRRFLLVCTLGGAAGAATLDEAIVGDFDINPGPSLLTLEPGDNTIRGAVPLNDFDVLTLTVPPGLQILSVVLNIQELVVNPRFLFGDFSFIGADGSGTGPVGYVDDGPVTYDFTANPLPAQTYVLAISSPLDGSAGDSVGSASYTATLTTNLVPEPATLGLLATLPLVLARRRKQA